ncbi:SAM-dependent methyltransferase [Actinosynnema sp. NPDC053489]|uniref:SAM-dependent methyltransferase n=1 Tax=Actinosynnema sp. NPDC053489 TaxID=3363916 RepID=UPI0037CCBDE7
MIAPPDHAAVPPSGRFAPPHPTAAEEVRRLRRHEREFLTRATIFMLDRGIRQFLDLGSGLPTEGGPHDTLTYLGVDGRVVHVDSDPEVVRAGRSLVRDTGRRGHFLCADAADAHDVLAACAVNGWLDLDEPVGVLAVGLLHLLPPRSDPWSVVPRYCAPLVGGSAAAITHLAPRRTGADACEVARLVAGPGGSAHPRGHADVVDMFAGLRLVKPGVVALPYRWAPGLFPSPAPPVAEPVTALAGLGVKW